MPEVIIVTLSDFVQEAPPAVRSTHDLVLEWFPVPHEAVQFV